MLQKPFHFPRRPIVSEVRKWEVLETRFAAAVKLERRPVAVSYLDHPPDGVGKFEGSEPSGCSFWRLAADGRTFYTVPEDHFNCAVGAYTHNILLSPERQQETGITLKMMFDLGYVRPEELPQIPRLAKVPAVVVYSPLGDARVTPDVVVFGCRPRSAMLLNEASHRAGVASGAIFSLGCVGNRVYTGLGEDQMYCVVRGQDLEAISAALDVVNNANAALQGYAIGRRQKLSTA
jgi:uncharacterized protein (DUF169 family)